MLDINAFIDNIKTSQSNILKFIDNNYNQHESFEDLIAKLNQYFFTSESKQFKIILNIINAISNNHYRLPLFFEKIEKILLHFKKDILKNFTNSEIFHIFHNNKRIVLFLFEEQILTVDQSIYNLMTMLQNYIYYFSPEINSFLYGSKTLHSIIDLNYDTFLQFRKIGENESFLCELIRNDSIIEFIKYVNQKNISLLTKIKPSIFETNPLLNKHKPTLIKYSAFFGSIQIFRYLINCNVKPTKSLWIYAIHGKNADIIHFLEENNIIPKDVTYTKCINESIKCHHNEISEYFLNSHLNELKYSSFKTIIKYYNFKYFSKSLISDFNFYDLCKYDYYLFVEYLLDTENININNNYHNNIPPIKIALLKNNFDIFQLLIKQKSLIINDYCFSDINTLESIVIPPSVLFIGMSAFKSCESLRVYSFLHFFNV